jgi:hypothetical protein
MTVDELIKALIEIQRLGYGQRIVCQYGGTQLDISNTVEITGIFAGSEADDDEVVVETVTWSKK